MNLQSLIFPSGSERRAAPSVKVLASSQALCAPRELLFLRLPKPRREERQGLES